MIRKGLTAVLAACALAAAVAAHAQSFRPFTIKDIRVEGLQRTEPGTVFSYLPVKVGETMDEAKAQSALRALYVGEAVKVGLVVLLFVAVLKVMTVAPLAMLAAYVATFFVYWGAFATARRGTPRHPVS